MTIRHSELLNQDVASVRAAIRSGSFVGQTAGLAAGKLQANLVILPSEHAESFETYCHENPRPCPLVGKTDVGNPNWTTLGDINIVSDVPRYNIYRDGVLDRSATDISDLWQDNWVAFALGCSFTFEAALLRAGVPVHHIAADRTVPMYRTNVETKPAGPFRGGMVVSMRRIPEDTLDSLTILKRPIFPVRSVWVPPQSSLLKSARETTRTRSPYFSSNRAVAPDLKASSASIS